MVICPLPPAPGLKIDDQRDALHNEANSSLQPPSMKQCPTQGLTSPSQGAGTSLAAVLPLVDARGGGVLPNPGIVSSSGSQRRLKSEMLTKAAELSVTCSG